MSLYVSMSLCRHVAISPRHASAYGEVRQYTDGNQAMQFARQMASPCGRRICYRIEPPLSLFTDMQIK